MRFISQIMAGVVLTAGASLSASAAPILIDYDFITADTLEDFQSIPLGDITSQNGFSGFSYQDAGVAEINGGVCDPNSTGNQCLAYSYSGDPARFFNLNASVFGLEIFSSQILTVQVQGGSGSSSFDLSGGFFGFYDAQGLTDITIDFAAQSGGGGCFSCSSGTPFNRSPNQGLAFGDDLFFDNVITQANFVATVPEPATIGLFVAALLGIGLLRRKRIVNHSSQLSLRSLRHWPTCKTLPVINVKKTNTVANPTLSALTMLVLLMVSAHSKAALLTFDNIADWQNAFDPGSQFVTDPFTNSIARAPSIRFDSGVMSTANDTGLLNRFDLHEVFGTGEFYFNVVDSAYVFNLDVDAELSSWDAITWEFPFAVHGFAMNWSVSNSPNERLTLGIGNELFTFSDNFGGAPRGVVVPTTFLGFYSDQAFSTLTFSATSSPQGAAGAIADNLIFGGAAQSTAVPEAPALPLLLTGLAFLATRTHKLTTRSNLSC